MSSEILWNVSSNIMECLPNVFEISPKNFQDDTQVVIGERTPKLYLECMRVRSTSSERAQTSSNLSETSSNLSETSSYMSDKYRRKGKVKQQTSSYNPLHAVKKSNFTLFGFYVRESNFDQRAKILGIVDVYVKLRRKKLPQA